MKAYEITELTKLNTEQLNAKVAELKAELFTLRFQLATGQLQNPKQIAETRRDIARVKTVLRQKELA